MCEISRHQAFQLSQRLTRNLSAGGISAVSISVDEAKQTSSRTNVYALYRYQWLLSGSARFVCDKNIYIIAVVRWARSAGTNMKTNSNDGKIILLIIVSCTPKQKNNYVHCSCSHNSAVHAFATYCGPTARHGAYITPSHLYYSLRCCISYY